MTTTPCTNCEKPSNQVGLCNRCHTDLHRKLDDILELWHLAHNELLPGKSGNGGRSSERTIGLNVNALSFIAGDDILGCLHEWEKLIREERNLTPPALIAKPHNLEGEITEAVRFAQQNLTWSGTQDWFEDYANEIKDLYAIGMTAAKQYVAKTQRIPCPAETSEGICDYRLKLNESDPMELFECKKCHTQWSTLRLVAVAMSDPNRVTWLDVEAIAVWVGISERQVYRILKENKIDRKGNLYDVKAFRDAYVNA